MKKGQENNTEKDLPEAFFIRRAGNADIPDIKNVIFPILRSFGLEPDENKKDRDLTNIDQSYAGGYFGVLVHVETGTIIGTFGLFRCDDETCELRKMYLMEEYRGLGLGKMMLTTAIDISRGLGFKRIYLETISPLKTAISLYKSFGFTAVSPLEINSRVDQAYELFLTGY